VAVAGLVAEKLLQPEFRAVLGPGRVFRATMPETAVYKHDDAEPGEDEVGADPASGADASQGFGSRVSGLGSGSWGLGIQSSVPRRQTPEPRPYAQSASSPPADDAIRPENLNQPQFGVLIARSANAGHDVGPLCPAEDIITHLGAKVDAAFLSLLLVTRSLLVHQQT